MEQTRYGDFFEAGDRVMLKEYPWLYPPGTVMYVTLNTDEGLKQQELCVVKWDNEEDDWYYYPHYVLMQHDPNVTYIAPQIGG